MDLLLSIALYGLPLAVMVAIYMARQRRTHARHRRA